MYAIDVSLQKNLLVVSSMDGVVKVWDLKDWNLLATIVPPGKDYSININRVYLKVWVKKYETHSKIDRL